MSKLKPEFARVQHMIAQVIGSRAPSSCEDWSSLSPAAISLLMPGLPSSPAKVAVHPQGSNRLATRLRNWLRAPL